MGSLVFFLIGSLLLQLAALACFIGLVAEMFSHDEGGWAITCIVLLLCGMGQLLALIYGCTKIGEWEIGLLVLANALCIVGGVIQAVLFFTKFAALLTA